MTSLGLGFVYETHIYGLQSWSLSCFSILGSVAGVDELETQAVYYQWLGKGGLQQTDVNANSGKAYRVSQKKGELANMAVFAQLRIWCWI